MKFTSRGQPTLSLSPSFVLKLRMAMNCNRCYHNHHLFSHNLRKSRIFVTTSSLSLSNYFPSFSFASLILQRTRKFPFRRLTYSLIRFSLPTVGVLANTDRFTWDDVFQVSQSKHDEPSDLQGFFDKIKLCNRNSEKHTEFVPFIVEDQIVGYVHHGFAEHLRSFQDVFVFPKDNFYGSHLGYHVMLHPTLKLHEDRTRAVGDVVKCLAEELIPGIRNELYPVTSSFGSQVHFSLERAAAPYFGIKAYGVHMNGYVESEGQKYLWVGKRSEVKPTFPGMLDHLVAGGLPHGIPCGENLVKECEEEAGIPKSISNAAIPVGAVSYMDIDGCRYKRDVLFCYDLKLPKGFIPENQDGEVESFKLIPLSLVSNIIRRTQFFKPNCNLVIMDFLFRHGYIRPEALGYLKLLQSLRSGDCS